MTTINKYTSQEEIEAMRQEILREKEKLTSKKGLFSDRLPSKKKTGKAVGSVIFIALSVILVWSIVTIQISKGRGEIPNLLGFQLFAVESGSMEPTLKVGAMIVSRKTKNPDQLKVHDIVTFRTLSNAIVTHRIIEVVFDEKGSKAYRTKGDNPRNSPDQELLTPNRVIGVFVAKIPLT